MTSYLCRMKKSLRDEREAVHSYKVKAKRTRNKKAKRMFMELSRDEAHHVKELSKAIRKASKRRKR